MTKPTYIYIMRCEGIRKIGVAERPHIRLRAIDGGPFPVVLEYSELCPPLAVADAEERAHQMLADCRVRGEWFRVELERAKEVIDLAIHAAVAALPDQPSLLESKRILLGRYAVKRMQAARLEAPPSERRKWSKRWRLEQASPEILAMWKDPKIDRQDVADRAGVPWRSLYRYLGPRGTGGPQQ